MTMESKRATTPEMVSVLMRASLPVAMYPWDRKVTTETSITVIPALVTSQTKLQDFMSLSLVPSLLSAIWNMQRSKFRTHTTHKNE